MCIRDSPDTALDFQINFPDDDVQSSWLWRFLERLTPEPDAAFLLLVSVDESQRRSVLKNEPFPDSADVLATRLAAYETWPDEDRFKWIVLDGTSPLEEIGQFIQSQVEDGRSDTTSLAGIRSSVVRRTHSA